MKQRGNRLGPWKVERKKYRKIEGGWTLGGVKAVKKVTEREQEEGKEGEFMAAWTYAREPFTCRRHAFFFPLSPSQNEDYPKRTAAREKLFEKLSFRAERSHNTAFRLSLFFKLASVDVRRRLVSQAASAWVYARGHLRFTSVKNTPKFFFRVWILSSVSSFDDHVFLFCIGCFKVTGLNRWICTALLIRLSEKLLSFYKEIIDGQCFLFYISLLNYTPT